MQAVRWIKNREGKALDGKVGTQLPLWNSQGCILTLAVA